MDIQVSSNFERLLFDVFDRDARLVTQSMASFREGGSISVGAGKLSELSELFSAGRLDDDETLKCIADVYRRTRHVLDPHSAVGYLSVEDGCRAFGDGPCVVLCTAHPVKFREAVEPAIGSSVPVPERLTACLEAERHVTTIPPEASALGEFLLEG